MSAASPASSPSPGIQRLRRLLESSRFQTFIVAVIAVNAVTLGLETSPALVAEYGSILSVLDRTALAIFVAEIVLKLIAYRHRFFVDGWNVFDFLIVGVTLLPAGGNLSVLRALRILRVLRLLSIVPQLKRVVAALFGALPGMGAIGMVLLLMFYVSGVLSTKLFGESFPEYFGSLGASIYSLFQVMTLESWSMGIVRPVMDVYPWAWLFFVPYIVLVTFMVLNLFIAIIVNSMQTLHESEGQEQRDAEADERREHAAQVKALRHEVAEIRQLLERRDG
jgi:voltage-gated sodium channel